MIECRKDFDSDVFPSTFEHLERSSHVHDYQLYQKRPTGSTYGKVQAASFYYRIPRLWNKLPKEVVSSENINTFKNRIDKHWQNAEFKFDWWSSPPELQDVYLVV